MTPTTCDCAGCTLAYCTRRNAEIADQLCAAQVQVLKRAIDEADRFGGYLTIEQLQRMADEIATSPEPKMPAGSI
jgi:hypothetical protein